MNLRNRLSFIVSLSSKKKNSATLSRESLFKNYKMKNFPLSKNSSQKMKTRGQIYKLSCRRMKELKTKKL